VRPGNEVDFSFSWRDKARIRANAFYQRSACSLSLRRIPMEIPTPEELGLPAAMAGILRSPSGLVLVTGPTGSGKSTSMASMIDVVNHYRPCHIVTIEDPIEYIFQNRKAAVSQREVGTDTATFDHALRAVLREDPDVVLVGEMRDLESISAALTIAETGHLVITTLHTNDSAQAIDRIIDVFAAERRNQIQVQLAGTLLSVLYQRLVPKIGGGMVAAYELMVGVPAVRNLVREGKTRQLRNVVATHRADGMQTLEHHLSDLIQRGVIEYDVAVEASLYPQDIPRPRPQPLAAEVA
jgi:twitching motility protein PilT